MTTSCLALTYRIITCSPEKVEDRLLVLKKGYAASQGSYRSLTAEDVDEAVRQDERFSDLPTAGSVLKQMLEEGLSIYLFTVG